MTPEIKTTAVSYVVGFMFSTDLMKVALIRKLKPAWQQGKLNGVGGKIEQGESGFAAMCREFAEETGYKTTIEEWGHFAEMFGDNDGGEGAFKVDFYAAITGDIGLLRSTTQEQIEIVPTAYLSPMSFGVVENIPWLVSLAVDYMRDGRPCFVTAAYPKWR